MFANLNDDIATCMLIKYMLVWESNRFGIPSFFFPSFLFLLSSSFFFLPCFLCLILPSSFFCRLPSFLFLLSSSFPLPSFLFLFLLQKPSVWDFLGVMFRQWVFDPVGRNIGEAKTRVWSNGKLLGARFGICSVFLLEYL